jgi:uncharacterized membrane-anchored protein YitT (DUF2179 family)
MKRIVFEYLWIILGSLLYAFGTVCFIFPLGLFLGGTSGISVILTAFVGNTPGLIFSVMNTALLLLALIVLGKGMALKTLVGSVATTLFISLLERLLAGQGTLIPSPLLSAVAGAAIIAVASALLFYVKSSSGGTDIIALIIQKFSSIQIGKALLLTDVLIVVVGGVVSGWHIAVSSFVGLLIKTLGIDLMIKLIKSTLGAKESA